MEFNVLYHALMVNIMADLNVLTVLLHAPAASLHPFVYPAPQKIICLQVRAEKLALWEL